jgi:hypothetical protein
MCLSAAAFSASVESLSELALRLAISCCSRVTSPCSCVMVPARSRLVVDAVCSTCSAVREESDARVRLIRSAMSCSNMSESNRYGVRRAEQRRAAGRRMVWRRSSVPAIPALQRRADAIGLVADTGVLFDGYCGPHSEQETSVLSLPPPAPSEPARVSMRRPDAVPAGRAAHVGELPAQMSGGGQVFSLVQGARR